MGALLFAAVTMFVASPAMAANETTVAPSTAGPTVAPTTTTTTAPTSGPATTTTTAPTSAAPTPTPTTTTTTFSPIPTLDNCLLGDEDLDLRVEYKIDGRYAYFRAQANLTGYVALGFRDNVTEQEDTLMSFADIHVAYIDPTDGATVVDAYFGQDANGYPLPDTEQGHGCKDNILDVAGYFADNTTVVTWRRLIDTGEVCDYQFTNVTSFFIMYAWSTEPVSEWNVKGAYPVHGNNDFGGDQVSVTETTDTCTLPTPSEDKYCNDDETYCVEWEISGSDILLTITAETKGGWAGFGFSEAEDGGMVPSNVMIVWWDADSNEPIVSDRQALRYRTPLPIAQAATKATGGSYNDGLLVAKLSRPLVASTINASYVDINTEASMDCIWAINTDDRPTSPDDMSLTIHNFRGQVDINFSGGGATPTHHLSAFDKVTLAHGIVMMGAYLILMPLGIIFARYGKRLLQEKWFPYHWIAGVLATVVMATGFGLSLWGHSYKSGEAFFGKGKTTQHRLLGFIVVGLSFLQPLLGYYAHIAWDASRKAVPWWPDKAHWWIGRIVFLAGAVNIYIGMLKWGVPTGYRVVVYVWFGLVLCTMGAMHFLVGQTHHHTDVGYKAIDSVNVDGVHSSLNSSGRDSGSKPTRVPYQRS